MDPIIFAHRGANRLAPENTKAAFSLAYELGAQAIEFDVQLTSDEVPVVIHDATLHRTTNGQGLIVQHTLSELQQLSAGSWFDIQFSQEKILSLSQALDYLVPLGLYINIEIKANANSNIVPAVLKVLQQANAGSDQILISSFDPQIIEQFSALKKFSYALLVDELNFDLIEFAARKKCFSIHPSHHLLAGIAGFDFINHAHQSGLKVFVFTINDLIEAQELLTKKIDGYFTDNPLLYHFSS